MSKLWGETELHREEVRGVFIIGILAILIGLKTEQFVKLPEWSNPVINIIVFFWGLYVILIPLALSDDLLKKAFEKSEDKKIDWLCEKLKDFAHASIALSVIVLFGFIIYSFWLASLYLITLYIALGAIRSKLKEWKFTKKKEKWKKRFLNTLHIQNNKSNHAKNKS